MALEMVSGQNCTNTAEKSLIWGSAWRL